ncbi:MAG: C39 family peptidase [Peptoniphilaceae bacterium]|nr:C39 family peptidase [Peptoniphilaceae bacterium]MDD7383688.1 C39 family peptidase [Peptoniphilaceae bacterium]MDY3738785.1 C39 family peptidase [Peptoniphilaceae bacterium]
MIKIDLKRKIFFVLFFIVIFIFNDYFSFADNSSDVKLKTTDINVLKNNLNNWSNINKNAKFLLDNFEKLTLSQKYLVGNDIDTINFVYNDLKNNKNMKSYYGESVNLNRKTPFYLQWDERWAYTPLSDSIIGYAGCGPTSMAMVLSRLTNDKNITPITISQDANKYMVEEGISWDFFEFEADRYNLKVKDIINTKDEMINALNKGPLLVSVSKGYFTIFGHILVIDSYDDGKFIINDPNSIKNTKQKWNYEDFSNQIQKIWLVY